MGGWLLGFLDVIVIVWVGGLVLVFLFLVFLGFVCVYVYVCNDCKGGLVLGFLFLVFLGLSQRVGEEFLSRWGFWLIG